MYLNGRMTADADLPDRIDEHFTGPLLDPDRWTSSYLPAWSSRAESAATYMIDPDGLRLSIPPEQELWCADRHDEPIRVSAVQTGNWSGPVGSTQGQQPFRDGLTVREPQPTTWGFTPHFGYLEVELSARIGPASMFSAWMVGIEDRPSRSGEICLIEVFGSTVADGRAAVGSGIHPFRDPDLVEEFSAEPRLIDVSERHGYAVDWRPGRVDYFVDGDRYRTIEQAPDYPMQLIIGVFHFPAWAAALGTTPPEVPELVVHRVTGRPNRPG